VHFRRLLVKKEVKGYSWLYRFAPAFFIMVAFSRIGRC
jgi:hypothetical protein